MFRRKHHIRRAEQRIGTRREHFERERLLVAQPNRLETHMRANGLANPIALHRYDAFGPVERVKVVQQAFGVFGDLEEPLLDIALRGRCAASFAVATDDFLVRESDVAAWAPVHRRRLPIRKTAFVQLQEDPLGPPVVVRIARVDFARPVVHRADFGELTLERGDVVLGGDTRMNLVRDGVVFRRQTKRVPPHGMEHVLSQETLVPRPDVTQHISAPVTDMKPRARGVREHVEAVVLRARVVVLCGVDAVFIPPRAPFRFQCSEIVFNAICICHVSSYLRTVRRAETRTAHVVSIDLRTDALHQPWERYRFPHVRKTAQPAKCALDAQAETGVGHRTVPPQIEIPVEIFFA